MLHYTTDCGATAGKRRRHGLTFARTLLGGVTAAAGMGLDTFMFQPAPPISSFKPSTIWSISAAEAFAIFFLRR